MALSATAAGMITGDPRFYIARKIVSNKGELLGVVGVELEVVNGVVDGRAGAVEGVELGEAACAGAVERSRAVRQAKAGRGVERVRPTGARVLSAVLRVSGRGLSEPGSIVRAVVRPDGASAGQPEVELWRLQGAGVINMAMRVSSEVWVAGFASLAAGCGIPASSGEAGGGSASSGAASVVVHGARRSSRRPARKRSRERGWLMVSARASSVVSGAGPPAATMAWLTPRSSRSSASAPLRQPPRGPSSAMPLSAAAPAMRRP